MDYQAITYEITEGVAYITLNRPALMNALNTQMRLEITHAFKDAEQSARAVVMTGAGASFCSGQDLADAAAGGTIDMEATLRDEYVPMLKSIFDCKVPTICAVNGPAAGAGANLALAADVVIASEDAYFVQAFTRIGLIPDAGGTYWLPRQIGAARAMGSTLFADKVSANQARDWGMIYETAPAAEFEAHIKSRAQQLANGPTVAYEQLKKAIRGSLENTLDEQLALEAKLQAVCGNTHDFKEGVTAFLEKRAPRYEGR
ncbi:2-(1,2-epoxy-1,2-dihydrophenyl)acetyl-CoA isomerase [Yoonia maritima]|uniref:2-(1,2-epoxy-1,2-dihydrophenyl)acetyl-CoA isomerase n=1 Tax=Yoonia maritima TaxID=1435347 RepID=A0A2T0W1E9_9RHOB|nr:enoyl-CoA hydratase-related protein [Yoonia maritima]PRY78828.1 2-(1,2-epoxy-1,2-dihydrophenyl)acetyl-CoA isomerase [Yoonia maritima]